MFYSNDQRSYRKRKRTQEEDQARLRRTYSRNFILIILSLGAAVTIFFMTRFLATERRDPESERLERILQEEVPEADFTVTIDKSAEPPEIEVNAVVPKAPEDTDALIARIAGVIYHDSGYRRGFVAIRLFERLREGDGTALASIAVRRTSISEIGKNVERQAKPGVNSPDF